jgi:MFS family permease
MLSLGIGSMLLPNFLQDARGFSPATITLLSSGAALGTLTFGFIGLRMPAARRAPFLAAAWSIAVTAIGYLLFATSSWLVVIAVAWVFRGGMFATWTFLLGAIGQYVPRHLQSRAFAVVEILGGGALSFSPIVAASLYGVNALLPLLVSAALSFAMAGIIVWRHRRGFRAISPAVHVEAATQTPAP